LHGKLRDNNNSLLMMRILNNSEDKENNIDDVDINVKGNSHN